MPKIEEQDIVMNEDLVAYYSLTYIKAEIERHKERSVKCQHMKS